MKRFALLLFVILGTGLLISAQNPEPAGWYAGDMHVHRSCGGAPEPLSSMYSDMSTNNLDVISLLADMGNGEVQSPTTDLPLVNGQDSPVSTPGRIVHWDTEWHWDPTYTQYAHQAIGGHIVALGLTNAQQMWQEYTYPILNWAHQQGGIAGFAHMQYLDGSFPNVLTCCSPVEYPVEVALGSADFISEDVADSGSVFYDSGTSAQIQMNPEVAIQAYYKLLNSGFRPSFVAGTDYPCNASRPTGALLTYAQPAAGQMTYSNWINAIKNGRTVVSRNGHNEFLSLTVNGTATPGDEIDLASPGSVQVSIQWTASEALSGTIEVVSDGIVVASQAASASPASPVTWTGTVNFPKSGWLAARRMGADGHQVHTAAVFVIVSGAPIRANSADPQYYVNWMNSLLANTSAGGAWNSYFPTSLSAAQARYQAAKTLFQQIANEAQGTGPTLSSISITPGNQTVSSGSTQQFVATGTYSDGSSQNLTAQVAWASSNTKVATLSPRGLASASQSGTSVISAKLGTRTGTATLTVQAAPLVITTQSLPAGTTKNAYSATLTASGGLPQYAWLIASGSLPAGLSLSTSGAISGTPTAPGTFTFTVKVTDSSSPTQTATQALSISITGTTSCPCTIWPSNSVPSTADAGGDAPVEVGVAFKSDSNGYITALRFYKGAGNTGTHIGHLWTSSGTLLATATFSNETASGWQQVNLSNAVAINANTTYIASYHTNVGHYADDQYYFSSAHDNSPLHAPANTGSAPNGVYAYGSNSAFPNQGWNSSNYWVDVVFATSGTDSAAPTVTFVSPSSGATGADPSSAVIATFSEPIDPSTISSGSFQLLDASGALIPATVAYDVNGSTAKLVPSSELSYSSTYRAVVKGGVVKDLAGNALASDYTWSFTTGAVPPPPPNDGPGGPILIVSSSTNPFSRYYTEILRAEGFNEFLAMDISSVSSATLANYDLVILGDVSLSASQISMFSNWVSSGGNLIAMHPDKQLAGLLGLADKSATLNDEYLLFNTASGPGSGLVNQTVQFHGSADLYSLNGAKSLGTLYSGATTSTSNPAVTLNQVGLGQAAAFTYDLAKSVIYTRQGNPAWSGQARDGQSGPMRSDDLYYGAASFDPQDDYVDLTKVAIPQADEQQRLLANLILQMNQAKRPLPRFWYFPRGLKAVVVMTGDDHGALYGGGATADRFDYYNSMSPAGCSVSEWQCVRGTSYLIAPVVADNPLTNSQAANYASQGFEIGVHVDSIPDCIDWTTSALVSAYSTQISSFAAQYPSLPATKTHRMHCVSWSDYDSQPQVELQNGIRLDTTYYYWPDSWINDTPGLFTGSGMPMRFAKRDGTMLDIYQAATQMTDESGQTYPKTIDTLLNNALGAAGYYGVFTANMHNDSSDEFGAVSIVESAQAHGVPVISAAQMLTWLDGRNGSSFNSLAWNGNALTFSISIATGANGLQAMLPTTTSSGTLSNLTLNGSAVSYALQKIKGMTYAVFPAGAGSYQATYSGTVPVSVTSVSLNPSSVMSGASSTGTVTLSGAAPSGGATVTLSTSDALSTTLPQTTVTVPQGATTATFTVNTNSVTANTNVTISASYGGNGASAVLTITPLPTVSSLGLSPTSVVGGTSSTATITLTQAAPAGGAVVNLSSTNAAAATVPASITLPAGTTTTTFTVTTYAVGSSTSVTISASYTGNTATALLTVTPQPTITSITLSPTAVIGGNSSTATVSLSQAAPTGGTVVPLSSNNTAVATVPASITISAGNTSGTVTVTTNAVASQSSVVITASYGSANKSATLTVNPQPTAVSITTTSVPAGLAGTAYSSTLGATGGTTPYTWSISSGSLPAGLSIASTTGVISGIPSAAGTFNFSVKVIDSSAPAQSATQALSIVIATSGNCPCTIWPNTTVPTIADSGPDSSVELGVTFRADATGYITGVRFYKGSGNTGSHVANLWSSTGSLLATATFSNETSSGWQQVNFASPVAITANTTYVASYHTNVGHYSDDQNYFTSAVDRSPLHALASSGNTLNGVYAYGSSSSFPNQSWHSSNYWVDVVYISGSDTTPPAVTSVSPANGATSVSPQTVVSATFSESLNATTVTTTNFQLLNSGGNTVAASVAYSSATNTATLTPTSALANSTTYTALVKGGGVKDLAGNSLAADYKWSFTTVAPATLVITTQSLSAGSTTMPYSAALAATGGTSPYSWSLSGGALPTGLVLSTAGVISGVPAATGTFNFTVKVTDSGSPAQTATQALSISIAAAGSTSYSLWPTTAVPTIPDAGADASVEVGIAFRSDTAGYITAIRFYKGAGNVSTHIANLWTSTGTLLATATFTNESASGWQQVMFSSPIAIQANTVYVASYHTNTGHYADDQYFFATSVDAAPLHAPATGLGSGNGLFAYGSTSTFPDQSWHTSNYWVDVVFVPSS